MFKWKIQKEWVDDEYDVDLEVLDNKTDITVQMGDFKDDIGRDSLIWLWEHGTIQGFFKR